MTGRSAAYNYSVATGDHPPRCLAGFGIQLGELVVDALINRSAVPVWWPQWFRKRKPASGNLLAEMLPCGGRQWFDQPLIGNARI